MFNKTSLDIVIVSYKRVKKLQTLIYSLLSQTRLDFSILVIHDGPDKETREAVASISQENKNIEICYLETQARFNDYGHSLREIGLKKSSSKFTLLTNDDNYYTPNFVEEMLGKAESQKSDVVYCDMVHSHVFHDLPNPIGYQTLYTEIILNRIDMGAFIFKTKLGQKVGFSSRAFEADWLFLEEMLHFKPTISKVEKVLFVHN